MRLRPRIKRRFSVLLVRPSKYDDEGYVIRYAKGVLPSNTLAALGALTRQAFDSGRFGADLKTDLVLLDDTIQPIDAARLARRYLGAGRRAVVAFAGVQSNQFPRASDLALRFKQAGFEAMIGGFHVSGAVAMSRAMPPECQALIDAGVTLVKGEVEDVWGDLLEDAWRGRLQPFYDIIEKPDISEAPIPMIDRRYQRRFAYERMGTIDTSRGCPFGCTFCTIINVQGRRMRCRSAATVARQIERNYHEHRIDYYFFTDDNFSRNRNWEAIFDELIRLREEEQIRVEFMMQVDMKACRIPRFIDKAALAGCTQVFLGVESLNEDNLRAIDKNQNLADETGDVTRAWHDAGVACHAGYIIGFPFDTPASVARDVERLKAAQFDQCSFFMLTPLPGSADHARMVEQGDYLDSDYNTYDSYHETLRLPGFAPGEWYRAYIDAWTSFYSFDNMRDILRRSNRRTYWGLFKNFMWYRGSLLEGIHPMVAGLWRLKPRTDRRPGYAVEGRLRHAARRLGDFWKTAREWARLFFELQELWLQTRIRSDRENSAREYLDSLRGRLGNNVSQLGDSIGAQTAGMRQSIVTGVETLGARASEMRQSIGARVESLGARVTEARQSLATGVESLGARAAAARQSLGESGASARDWIQASASGLSDRVRASFDYLQEKSLLRSNSLTQRFSRLLVRWSAFGRGRLVTTRVPLNQYWRQLAGWVRQGRLARVSFETPRICLNFLRDLRLATVFFLCLFNELTSD